jgi:Periplasmic copper-binding protein (NosD)
MTIRSRTGFLFLAALAALAPCVAHALDGEVLIDQAKVTAGGVTPADTPGFPVTISRSGKYKLTGNLAVPAGTDGFVVTADNVTIDFNGFRIVGGRFGINAAGADGLTAMNGTVVNFSNNGIRARGFAIIQDMQVVNNDGMGVKLDNNGRVVRSTISNSKSINVYCVSRCLISGNVITASRTESGIGLFTAAGGSLVIGNTIADNTLYAIYTEGEMAYANNTITGNGQFNGSSVIGPGAHQAHPNYCNPACP